MSGQCVAFLQGAALEAGFCASVFARDVKEARGLVFDARDGAVLVVQRGTNEVLALYDDDGDGVAETRLAVAAASGLNHGIALDTARGWLFASSDSTVYRWEYAGSRTTATNRVVVVRGMPTDGHPTRTLMWNASHLWVSIGSKDNVDADSRRSRVKLCALLSPPTTTTTTTTLDFEGDCSVWSDGVRNEAGLAFDRDGVLWGVENGADRLFREDLGGDLKEDNPAEEVNRLDEEGAFYGYPQCFTEYDLPFGRGRGTVWAWPDFLESHGDEWCRQNAKPPVLALQAHSAPLGITFFNGTSKSCPGTFPAALDGQAFIGFHGSWNRDVPTGYKVVRVPHVANASSEVLDFLWHGGTTGAKWPSGFRPVDVVFDGCGRLLVSSDGTRYSNGQYSEGVVVRICYGDCGGANYSAIWSDRKENTANEWYETTAFHASAAVLASLLLTGLFACFFFCRSSSKQQRRAAPSSTTKNPAVVELPGKAADENQSEKKV